MFATHVVLVVTPTAFGGKPYGMTVAWAIIVVFAVVVYRKLWAQYRAYQERPPSEGEPEP
ncbi:hypothetical protein [Nocardiopsis sp. HUAS JQ3]|uniref:hypothetical protein n=1 Tax=Nocardiopsis sp. HUAS JQ3 TaxID=3061629 RepID=UPI0023A99949|nr:hypothetical protein [Nocardiopsis sp. HUAS JQ3]WDZ90673.1 hypothetical protein PV789_27960 [Nocardiopsis sp. HUAS JQ3]